MTDTTEALCAEVASLTTRLAQAEAAKDAAIEARARAEVELATVTGSRDELHRQLATERAKPPPEPIKIPTPFHVEQKPVPALFKGMTMTVVERDEEGRGRKWELTVKDK